MDRVAGSKELGAGSRDHEAGTRDQGPGTRDQGPGTRDQGWLAPTKDNTKEFRPVATFARRVQFQKVHQT